MAGRHARTGVYAPPPARAARAARAAGVPKVPAVKPYFWLVKLLTTAMGEAVSDLLVQKVNPYLAVTASFFVFAAAIGWQFRTRGYRTWPYWSAVAMVAVFGTMMADALHVAAGVPYQVSAAMFAVALVIIFAAWRRVEGTLSIHSVRTPRRESFYWAAVCATFAMDVGGLGFGHEAVSVATLVLVITSFWYLARTGIDAPAAPLEEPCA